MRFAIVLLAAAAACGCSQNVTKNPTEQTEAAQPTAPGRGAAPPADNAAPASGEPAQFAYSPDAPNWSIAATKLADNRWRLELRMRRWHTGGDGEAEVLFREEARELADKQGYRHYVVLSWVQGIDSTAPIAQRWARGEVELTEALPPMPLDKP